MMATDEKSSHTLIEEIISMHTGIGERLAILLRRLPFAPHTSEHDCKHIHCRERREVK